MESPAYLDNLFGALRELGEQRKASARWLSCAGGTTNVGWKLTFLRAGRSAHLSARRLLDDAAAQLGPVPPARTGVSADAMPPLERLAQRLMTVRAELDSEERRLAELETALARQPAGTA